jgi:hypothetical protein
MISRRNAVLEQALKATWEILSDESVGMPELIETKVYTSQSPSHNMSLLK